MGETRWTERTTMGSWADRFGTHVKEAKLSQRPDVWKTMAELELIWSSSSGAGGAGWDVSTNLCVQEW